MVFNYYFFLKLYLLCFSKPFFFFNPKNQQSHVTVSIGSISLFTFTFLLLNPHLNSWPFSLLIMRWIGSRGLRQTFQIFMFLKRQRCVFFVYLPCLCRIDFYLCCVFFSVIFILSVALIVMTQKVLLKRWNRTLTDNNYPCEIFRRFKFLVQTLKKGC